MVQETCITNDTAKVLGKKFDYVIAGGGLTGLTVASRLTEDKDVTVLVIEGGKDNRDDKRVYDVRTFGEHFESDLDYKLETTPVSWQDNKNLHMTAGKTLGGSGSFNGASWTKGPRTQYDLLPCLTGDESWGWEGLNEHMKHAEHFNEPQEDLKDHGADFKHEHHGKGGPVHVSFAQGMFRDVQLPALDASQKIWSGLERIPDVTSGVVNGVTTIPNMLLPDQKQNRSSPLTAYIEGEPETRKNLVILTGHRVTRILWKDDDDRLTADGLEFQASQHEKVISVRAKREILLAAGALQSPQLLELSGVGDPAILKKAGVELRRSIMGVGKNLQEQTKNTLTFKLKDADFDGSGPASGIAFPNVHQILGDKSAVLQQEIKQNLSNYANDLEAAGRVANTAGTLSLLDKQVHNLFEQNEPAAEIFFSPDPDSGTVGADAWALIPLTRGTVHIKSTNSFDEPEINPVYFGHPLDIAVQTAATMQLREVFNTEPLAGLIESETTPGLEKVPKDAGKDAWEQWVKKNFTSVWHPIATLSMMKEELGGVVDSRLRVYGIDRLRVIDASVLPIQLSAHLSSSLYGIAEKAAVMIKEDRNT